MNMIERVQEAIWQIGAANDITQEDARHLARAAIEAMMEPTQGIIEAMEWNIPVDGYEWEFVEPYTRSDGTVVDEAKDCWKAMIRAALEEK